MADRYAVGTGNWNDTSTWSDSSGGTTGQSVPVDGDDVIFDGNSGTVTLNAAARCDTITLNGGGTLDTDSSNDYALTVDEQMYLASAGTFNANGSTVKIGDGVTSSLYTLKVTNGTFNGGDGIHTIGCIHVNGGTCNLSQGTTTINGAETSSSAGIMQVNSGTLAHSNGTVIFDVQNYSNSIILLYGADITLYNVYLDATTSAQKLQLWGAGATSPRRKFTVANNLFIRGGRFLTQYSSIEEVDLDVTGNISVIPSASAGTDIKSELSTFGSVVNVGGTLTSQGTWNSGGSNYTPKALLDLGSGAQEYNAVSLLTGGDVTMSSGVTTIDGAGTAFRFDIQNSYNTYSNGSGTIKFTSSSDQTLYSSAQAADDFTQFHNLILEKTSSTLQGLTTVGFHIKVGADLTITSGILNTNTTNGTNHALTVTGECEVSGGTLTLNDSTVNVGDMKITSGTVNGNTSTINLNTGGVDGWVWFHSGGTWNYNTSTVVYKTNGKHMEGEFYNLIIECASSTHTGVWRADGLASVIMKCANDLTVKEGIWKRDAAAETMTIDGDVSIESGGTLGQTSETGANSFGSLTIASGGEYIATSGTTEITGEAGTGYAIEFSGTYTHNSGTLKVTTDANTFLKANNGVNNLIIEPATSTRQYEWVNNATIQSNLTINAGTFKPYNDSYTIDVNGDVLIENGGTLGKTAAVQAFEFGSLTIASGGEYIATSGTTTINGSFDNNGTDPTTSFIHNNGTILIEPQAASGIAIYGSNTGTGTVFYNLTCGASETVNIVGLDEKMVIENHWDNNAKARPSGEIRFGKATATTAAEGGTVNTGPRLQLYGATLIGLSTVHPCVFSGDGIDYETSSALSLSNLDWSAFSYTVANNPTITLNGDMIFGGLTINGGTNLDLNEQRVNFAGYNQVVNDGTIDATNALMYLAYFGGTGTFTNDANTKVVYQNCDGSRGSWRFAQNTSGVSMLNDGKNHDLAHDTTIGKLILGDTSATGFGLSSGGNEKDLTVTDLTITTGATLVDDGLATGSVITCSGDFTMSGGLIGRSALSFPDGGDSPSGAGNALDVPYDLVNLTGDATIEFWMYADANTNANSRGVINGYKASVANRWQLYQTTSNNLTFYSHDNNKSITVTCPTGKWSHVAIVCTGAGGDVKLYINGKLEGQTNLGGSVSLATSGAFPDFGVNRQDGSTNIRTGQSIFEGELAMLRIWTDERTESELRANMFATYANLASNTGCAIAYEFDEGTGTDVDDKVGSNNGTLINSVTWAGAGTFTQGTSTVDLTGTGELVHQGTIDFNILKVAAATKTTTVRRLSSGDIRINTNLYKGAGTLTRSGAVTYRISDKTGVGSVDNNGTSISGASYPVDLSNTYVVYYHDTSLTKEVKFQFYINGSDTTFQANQEATEYWNNAGYETNVGNYNLKCKYMKYSNSANGKFIMANGDLWLTNSVNGLQETYPSNTFTVGPGATVSGSTAGTNFKSQNNFSVVGSIENLDVTNEELSVLGNVTNCTGDIHRWNPTIDTGQMLDADTADDRDVRLGSDLDRNTELVT